MQLESYRLPGLETVFYVPSYISDVQAEQILTNVRVSQAKWVQVTPIAALACVML